MSKNDINEDKNDLHLAEDDYRHLNLPKHENVSIKDVINQLESQQQANGDQASLYPFHITLAEANVAPASAEHSDNQPASDQVQNPQAAVDDAIVEDEEPLAEDPGVLLLPDTIDDVVRIEVAQEGQKIKLPVDDDGSQDLYRIHHTNHGGVDDQPRDLGIPPVDYPLPKTYTTEDPEEVIRVARQRSGLQITTTSIEPECCTHEVEIKITSKLLYLGDYCCGDTTAKTEAFSSNYGWASGGGCDCGPYAPPEPPTPNYTVIFHDCDGEQWLDITICNSVDYGDTQRGYSLALDANYDDCCTTYRVEIPASFGLDCDCPIVELQTDQNHINSIWDLLYSQDTHFIDCHGLCYELTYSYESGSSNAFETFDAQISTSPYTFSLEPCECEEPVRISLVDPECGGGTTSGSTYYDNSHPDNSFNFSFTFESGDFDNNGSVESLLVFSFFDSFNSVTSTEEITIELPAGINCACPIEEIVFDQTDFQNYVNSVTGNYLSSALTSTDVLNFFSQNGFFEDCHNQCYDLVGSGSYSLEICDDCTRTELNVSYSCDLVDRFNSWVDNVAPGSFDPFQFFTDNVHFTQVDCNGASFIEVNFTSVDYALGDGFYKTYDDTLRISLPEGFCIDDFNAVVIDPKMIYEMYQDSCYQFGYSIGDTIYSLLNYDGIQIVNIKTGAEYEANYNSCTYSYELAPATCDDAICINTVNNQCDITGFNVQAAFIDGGCGCCGGECQTEYSLQTETNSIQFSFKMLTDQIQFASVIDNSQFDFFFIQPGVLGLSCINPIVNVVFDETDLNNYINDIQLQTGNLTGEDLINFFSQNGMFEDCKGNCYEIAQTDGNLWALQACTDCTHTPINVSIDDGCCQTELVKVLAAEESASNADKLAYFQNLYTMEYVNCNGASFVEFTYFCNDGADCKYSSFPACEQTIRITVPETAVGYGCNGQSYDISEILPHNEDASSLINNLMLNCGFIGDFFNSHFTDYCGNISYNISCDWGTDFLSYLQDSGGKFIADNGICYELTQNDCGDYVLGLGFEPEIMHIDGTNEATLLLVNCGSCDETPFLLGLTTDLDNDPNNQLFAGQHIDLPQQFDMDCEIDPCSFNLIYGDNGDSYPVATGFIFDVTCDGQDFDYKYTIDGGWSVNECCENELVPISGVGVDLPVRQVSDGIQIFYVSQLPGIQYSGLLELIDHPALGTATTTYSNDFDFNFSYTHCDIDHDGDTDSFISINFQNHFIESTVGSTGGINGYIFSPDQTIAVPESNGDCCGYSLALDDTAFGNALMDIVESGFGVIDGYAIDGYSVLNAIVTLGVSGDAIFTDCNNNTYILNGSYALEAYQTSGPVVLDLSGNGINLTHAANGVQYDMNNDGVKDQSAWIGDGNGLLVYDADQNHTVTNASEFVLTEHVAGAKSDLEALRIGFDSNHDDVFDQKDAAWNLFGIWQDANKDAVVDNGEYHTLAQLGIASIGLVSDKAATVESGNLIHGVASFAWANGTTGSVADVALHYQDVIQDVHHDSVTDPSVSNPTVSEHQVVIAQNDPVVQSTLEQMAHQASVATA
jgi:hypothetical protein